MMTLALFLTADFSIALAASGPPAHDVSAGSRNIEIAKLKDPKSGEEFTIEAPVATAEELNAQRPSALYREREQIRREVFAQCGARKSAAVRFAHDFIPESLGFHSAVAMSANLQAHGDPAALKHWWEQSILDPMSHASFAMFMISNRAAGEFFNMIGAAYDPCTMLKKMKAGPGIELPEMTKMQKTFSPVTGGLAMSVGLIVSSDVHELLADKDIQLCAAGQLGRVQDVAASERACDRAYQTWTVSHRIMLHMPDILSNIAISCAQGWGGEALMKMISKGAAAVPRLAAQDAIAGYMMKQAEGKAAATTIKFAVVAGSRTLILRGLTVAINFGVNVGKVVPNPIVKSAVFVGNMLVFLKANDLIMPYIQKPWVQWTDGDQVTKAMNSLDAELTRIEKNGWVYKQPDVTLRCMPRPSVTYSAERDYSTVMPADCLEPKLPPDRMLDLLAYNKKNWRKFILRDAFAETANWQDYVLQYTNTYSAALKVYGDFISQIANQKFLVAQNRGVPDYLFQPTPLGLTSADLDPSHWSGKVCELPDEVKLRVKVAREMIDKELATTAWMNPGVIMPDSIIPIPQMNPLEFVAYPERLKKIRAGLAALDCSLPMPLAPEIKKPFQQTTPQEINDLRLSRWNVAAHTLFNTLTEEQKLGYANWSDGQRDIDHPAYRWFARVNIFMRLNLLLGDVEPYPEGAGYVRLLNSQPAFISQEHKDQHPRHVGKIATPHMTEYLLAQMVCGPDATTQSTSQISTLQRLQGWRARFIPPRIIDDLGVNPCNISPTQGNLKMDVGHWPVLDLKLDPYANVYHIAGRDYEGLLDILKNHVRRDVLGNAMNDGSFSNWWAKYVDVYAKSVIATFRVDYERIISEKFLPALENQGRANYNNRTFALGAADSLMDDLKSNSALLMRLHKAGRAPQDPSVAELNQKLGEIQKRFQTAISMIVAKRPLAEFVTQASLDAFKQNKDALDSAINDALKIVTSAPGQKLTNEAVKTIAPIRDQVLLNLSSLVTELDSYHGILVSIRLDGLE